MGQASRLPPSACCPPSPRVFTGRGGGAAAGEGSSLGYRHAPRGVFSSCHHLGESSSLGGALANLPSALRARGRVNGQSREGIAALWASGRSVLLHSAKRCHGNEACCNGSKVQIVGRNHENHAPSVDFRPWPPEVRPLPKAFEQGVMRHLVPNLCKVVGTLGIRFSNDADIMPPVQNRGARRDVNGPGALSGNHRHRRARNEENHRRNEHCFPEPDPRPAHRGL